MLQEQHTFVDRIQFKEDIQVHIAGTSVQKVFLNPNSSEVVIALRFKTGLYSWDKSLNVVELHLSNLLSPCFLIFLILPLNM